MIINTETAAFVEAHSDDDVRQLALGKVPEGVDLQLALNQIDGRQRARKKLPTLAATEGIVYPPHISMEQCSSEATAEYKARLAKRLGGETMVDLTGGFGIDFIYMSRGFREATYVEQQEHLCEAARENFALLGMKDAKVVNCDGTSYLNDMQPVDLIYLDPARRDIYGFRVLFSIRDCEPNVLQLLPALKKKSHHIIIKLSPMLDWMKAFCELGNRVSEIHIVSVDGECKEMLMVAEDASFAWPKVYCVNIGGNTESYVFDAKDYFGKSDTNALVMGHNSPFGIEQSHYLLVPNASVMKSKLFELLSEQFSLPQISIYSHLYLSDRKVEGFPGKEYRIKSISTMNKRELRDKLSGISQANIAVRNFNMTTVELRKRLKLADGGDTYIFGSTTGDGKHLLFICDREK